MKIKVIESTERLSINAWVKTTFQIILGTLYVVLLSQVTIPLKPIPVSMQTFAVFTLALSQGSRKSFYSLVLYLFAATLGLPVLSPGYANSFWFLDPSAGYCASFPIAGYTIGLLVERKNCASTARIVSALCVGQVIIYAGGIAYLTTFVGFGEALLLGFYPFIFFDGVKMIAALATKKVLDYAIPSLNQFFSRNSF